MPAAEDLGEAVCARLSAHVLRPRGERGAQCDLRRARSREREAARRRGGRWPRVDGERAGRRREGRGGACGWREGGAGRACAASSACSGAKSCFSKRLSSGRSSSSYARCASTMTTTLKAACTSHSCDREPMARRSSRRVPPVLGSRLTRYRWLSTSYLRETMGEIAARPGQRGLGLGLGLAQCLVDVVVVDEDDGAPLGHRHLDPVDLLYQLQLRHVVREAGAEEYVRLEVRRGGEGRGRRREVRGRWFA